MCRIILTVSTHVLQNMNALIREKDETGDTTVQNVDKLATVYRKLIEARRNLRKCFGGQIVYLMTMAVGHIVCLVYGIIYNLLQNIPDDAYSSSLASYGFILMYTAFLAIISRTGQNLSNESLVLNRLLAKIICKGLTRSEAHTTLKDFQRLVSVQPMHFHLMPNMPMGMYLLPAFLTFAVNHVIVCLQLSHEI